MGSQLRSLAQHGAAAAGVVPDPERRASGDRSGQIGRDPALLRERSTRRHRGPPAGTAAVTANRHGCGDLSSPEATWRLATHDDHPVGVGQATLDGDDAHDVH